MGAILTIIKQSFPPKAKWTADDMPDMSGKVVIVTGGNSGIGKETVKALLEHKAKVYILSRDTARAANAIESLKSETGREALFIQMDLSDLASVKKAAEEFKRKEPALNVLINNAGVMLPKIERITKDGYDYQFGINALGHYFLTTLLLDQLKAASTTPGAPAARIVNVTSAGYILCKGINYKIVRDNEARRNTPALDLYNQSKFAIVVFTSELAKRYGNQNIVSTSVHPGLINTELGRDIPKTTMKFLSMFNYEAYQGAITSLYAATAPQTENANGKYFVAWAREMELDPRTLDPKTGQVLWNWFEEQVKDF